MEELLKRYRKVWSTWDISKVVLRFRELSEQCVRFSKECNAIQDEIKERLTCPRCRTNKYLGLYFYGKINSIACTRCKLEIPIYKTPEQALEAWNRVCQALSELEPENPVEPEHPSNEHYD